MTITLLTSTPAESYRIERQLIEADQNVEVNNPHHEDPVIYASRSDNPDDLIRRTIVRLIVVSDIVLNLSGQKWIDEVCRIIGIQVYHELEDIMGVEQESVTIPEPEPDEVWCGGCNYSDMQPLHVSVDECETRVKLCPTYKNFEDAINGENQEPEDIA